MFSRKKTEAEDRKMADASDDLGIPMKPTRPPAPDLVRAADAARTPEAPRRPGEPVGQLRRSDAEVRKLIVGREITLSGEITSCDKLIVEGSVEANLTNCRD